MSTGVVALAGVGLLVAAWVLDFVLPGSGIAVWSVAAAGIGCMVTGLLWDLRRVRSALSSRRGVFGIGTSVTLSLAIGIVVLANLVSTTVHHRFDFTGLKQFTLTTQTREVLFALESEVEVVSFYGETNPNIKDSREIAAVNSFGFELLKEYANYSELLDVRREDPELRPDLARQYGISPYGAAVGTVVFPRRVRADAGLWTADSGRGGERVHQRHTAGDGNPAAGGLLHHRPRRGQHSRRLRGCPPRAPGEPVPGG